MPPVAGLFKVPLQNEREREGEGEKRLSSPFHANITGWLWPRRAGRKQEVSANPGLP